MNPDKVSKVFILKAITKTLVIEPENLITNEEDIEIDIEKEQSWNNVLTTYTSDCKENILFKNQNIPVKQVTYVEGFSSAQFSMMKFSGMTGMLGNKIFLNNRIFINAKHQKLAID